MQRPNGTRINTVRWLPVEEADSAVAAPAPVAAMLFCHGYGHYCSLTYDWLSTHLAARGILTFGMEHVGHGKSEGLPGVLRLAG